MNAIAVVRLGSPGRWAFVCIGLWCGLVAARDGAGGDLVSASLILRASTRITGLQPAAPLSVLELRAPEVVISALENDLSLQTARRTLALQAEGVRVARGEFDPKLGARLTTQRGIGASSLALQSPQSQAQAALDATWLLVSGATLKLSQATDQRRMLNQPSLQSGSASLSLSQPLLRRFGPGITKLRLYNSESTLRVAVAGLQRQAALVVSTALIAYVGLQQAQAAVAQAAQAQELALRVHELNQALVAAGRSAAIVLLQSDSDIASARLALAQAENNERLAVRALAQAMGRTDGFKDLRAVPAEDIASGATAVPLDEAGLIVAALAQSPEMLAADEAVLVAQRDLDSAENELLPSLDLVASRTLPSGESSVTARADTTVGVNLEVSFDRAPRALARDTARASLATAQAQWAETQRQVRDAAVDAFNGYRFALAQLDLAIGASRLAALQQEAEATRQGLGQLSQLELSNAQRSVASANSQLRDAKVQLLRSQLDVSRLAGNLLQRMNVQQMVSDWVEQAIR